MLLMLVSSKAKPFYKEKAGQGVSEGISVSVLLGLIRSLLCYCQSSGVLAQPKMW
jgi:hypothetical protein